MQTVLKEKEKINLNTTRLVRWYYLKRCFAESNKAKSEKEKWISYALGHNNEDNDYSIIVNQICFELVDCLEISGEAFISGLFQIGLAIQFVGNNFVEDWFCTYPWIYRLRRTDDGTDNDIDVYSQKRSYAELLAKFSFAKYLCDYYLKNIKTNNFKTYLYARNIILTLEAFGNKQGGSCQTILEYLKKKSQAKRCDRKSKGYFLISSNEEDKIAEDLVDELVKHKENLITFALASDLIYYIGKINKGLKNNFLFINLPDDLCRMITRLSIDLHKICYEHAHDNEVINFENIVSPNIDHKIISESIKKFRNPIWYYSSILKLQTTRFFQDFQDWLF